MKYYTLENQFLKATFKTKGAELISLKKENTEYIWQGNPKFWNRHTPVLFPFVGALKNNTYSYNGETYHMGQHGFARDQDFELKEKEATKITFELAANKETLKVYPFHFVLQLTYTLTNNELVTSYRVKNTADQALYFSIGAHPAFNCPIDKNQTREDYVLKFDCDQTPASKKIEEGLIGNKSFPVFKHKGIIELTKNLFDKDALIFDPNPFSEVTLIHKATGKKELSIEFRNFPYLGIWSKNQESPFICIEPWQGIADNVNHNQELRDKEGILKLPKQQSFHCEYKISPGTLG
ncbi:MAG: aldose 1-epimerase family protein [Wenyingzhuangia sp.]|jgi:galactose mutarotase-like enzyme|uniref:aldose 1-epimerase family protein n=1 Tax=Wenyingzhuangia sp. TaxID=1964193 RepID=UPI00321AAA92